MAEQEKKLTGYRVSIKSDVTEETVKEFAVTRKQIKLAIAIALGVMATLLMWAVCMTILFASGKRMVQTVNTDLAQAQNYTVELEAKIEELTEKNTILSATVNRKVEEEEYRMAVEAALYEPTGIPIEGTVLYEEDITEDGAPYIEFTADTGTTVVAAGSGIVTMSCADEEWGYRIEIDHGNGYVSTYHVREEPRLAEGAEVQKGDTLFLVTKAERTIIYQILLNGEVIDPMGIMELYG